MDTRANETRHNNVKFFKFLLRGLVENLEINISLAKMFARVRFNRGHARANEMRYNDASFSNFDLESCAFRVTKDGEFFETTKERDFL